MRIRLHTRTESDASGSCSNQVQSYPVHETIHLGVMPSPLPHPPHLAPAERGVCAQPVEVALQRSPALLQEVRGHAAPLHRLPPRPWGEEVAGVQRLRMRSTRCTRSPQSHTVRTVRTKHTGPVHGSAARRSACVTSPTHALRSQAARAGSHTEEAPRIPHSVRTSTQSALAPLGHPR